jgi:hypothetical protein
MAAGSAHIERSSPLFTLTFATLVTLVTFREGKDSKAPSPDIGLFLR